MKLVLVLSPIIPINYYVSQCSYEILETITLGGLKVRLQCESCGTCPSVAFGLRAASSAHAWFEHWNAIRAQLRQTAVDNCILWSRRSTWRRTRAIGRNANKLWVSYRNFSWINKNKLSFERVSRSCNQNSQLVVLN